MESSDSQLRLRVVIFAAKSTPDERGSITQQVEACEAHAAAAGYVVDSRETDEAASAYSGNRGAGLARAIARAEALAAEHGRAGLLVWHSNRLARGGGDAPDAARHLAEYLFWAQRANVELHSVQDDATFSNPVLAVVMGEMARQSSKEKSDAVKRAFRARRKRGLHTGGKVYGYERDPERGLRPDPATAPIVVRIFQMVAAGKSQAEVARTLNAERIPPLRGAKWGQGSISAMLQRRTYLGEIPADDWRERRRRNIVEKWRPAAHEPIVTKALWDAANRQRQAAAARRGRGGGPRPKAGHLLPGRMLRHAGCGHAMTPRSGDPKLDGTVSGWYECSGRKAGLCEGFRVEMTAVDDAITSFVAGVGIDAEESLRLAREAIDARRSAAAAELEGARRDAAKAEADWHRVRRDYLGGKITAEDWADFRPELEGGIEATKAKVARLEQQAAERDADPEVIVPAVADALTLVRQAIEAGDTASVRVALEALFSEFLIGTVSGSLEDDPALLAAELARVTPEQRERAAEQLQAGQERVAELERARGKTVGELNLEAEREDFEAMRGAVTPQEGDPLSAGLPLRESVVILPEPRREALGSVMRDGEPVYLVDEEGREIFRRLPLPIANNDALTT